jgi:uncharacterized protein YcbX
LPTHDGRRIVTREPFFGSRGGAVTASSARSVGPREIAQSDGILVGTVDTLWRYPVKSMLGERVTELYVTERGALGDRTWALRDPTSGRIASAKKFPRLLDFRSRYESQPTLESRGRVVVETPNGDRIDPADPNASEVISQIVGTSLRLESQARLDERTGIDPDTVFGDVPVSEMKPEWTRETMPDYFQLRAGSFFEIGAVYLLASASVAHLRRLQGGTAVIDQRRFRPNIYIATNGNDDRFAEDEWLGGTLCIGDQLAVTDLQPTVWCVTSTLAQEGLPRDLSVLRTTAQQHNACLGVYASVENPGVVRIGDPVRLRK